MPFSGTGAFSLVAGNPVVTGTNISSVTQNNTMSDFANGFGNCVTRDGQSPPTANLPMGGQRHTGAANASGTGEYLVYGQNASLGYITKPNVSSVIAHRTGSNLTIPVSTVSTVVFDSEVIDRASNYDAATGIFTAPVAGVYSMTTSLRLQNNGVSATTMDNAYISKNNATTASSTDAVRLAQATESSPINPGSNPFDMTGSHHFSLAANDTLRVKVAMGTGGVGLNLLIGSAMSITFWG